MLLFVLVILLLVAYALNGRELSSPAFVFCASFVFMVSYAAAYTSRWKASLQWNTAIMVIAFVTEFIVISLFAHYVRRLIKPGRNFDAQTVSALEISTLKKAIILVVSIITVFMYVKYISEKAGLPILVAISRIYGKTMHIDVPIVYKVMNLFIKSLGFWFAYPIANQFVMNRKIDWISIAILFTSAVSTMLGGTRGVAVCMFVALLGVLLLLSYKKNRGKKEMRIRYILITVVVFILVIRNFSAIGSLVGRKTTINPMDYSAAYCGAPIYNLDAFLNGREFSGADRSVWGRLTFNSIEQTLSKYGIIEDVRSKRSYSPFKKSNGIFMGNVYTFFYSTLYDFGYAGTALFVAVVAASFQIFYDRAKESDAINYAPLSIVLYGYCFPLMFFAFFSNWVTGNIVCTGFVWNLMFWVILDIFFFKLKFKWFWEGSSDLFSGFGNI